jgi:hypothetical protein
MNQFPWYAVPCGFRLAGVVSSQSIFNVLTGAHVTATCNIATQDVNEKHIYHPSSYSSVRLVAAATALARLSYTPQKQRPPTSISGSC